MTVTPSTIVNLFTATDAPSEISTNDPSSVELGIKFQTSVAGTITGIRFYKNPYDTGTHVGHLWSAAGTSLATATFTNETASGWQQANFSGPVTLTAGTTYVASYHSNGFYTDDPNYFATARTTGPLTALSNGASGGNGLYGYGSSGTFPTNSYTPNGTNYWVDLVFNKASTSSNPVANNDSGFVANQNTPLPIPASALLANDSDPNGYSLSITGVGSATNGSVMLSADMQTVTFTPTQNYTGPASFMYTISNGHGGSASALVSLTVTLPTVSLFSASDTPVTVTENDPSAVELGVKFQTSTTGQVIGVRFYKGPQNTGTHVAHLWNAAGASLGMATFTNESASGWQQVNFSNPVTLTVGTTYIVSYHTNVGLYSVNENYFTSAHTNGPLTAPSSSTSGGNGVYAYGSSSSFPTNTFNASNYWVDVAFNAASGTNHPPVANNDSGFSTTQNTPLSIAASALLANDTDPDGDPLSITGVGSATNGSVMLSTDMQTVTFTPTMGYIGSASFTYTISDGRGGTASANVSLTVNAPSATSSLFSPSDTPSIVTENDPYPVELGVKFRSSVNGSITGFRFYKGPQNTGTHT